MRDKRSVITAMQVARNIYTIAIASALLHVVVVATSWPPPPADIKLHNLDVNKCIPISNLRTALNCITFMANSSIK